MIKDDGAINVLRIVGLVCLDIYNVAIVRQVSDNVIILNEAWNSVENVFLLAVIGIVIRCIRGFG